MKQSMLHWHLEGVIGGMEAVVIIQLFTKLEKSMFFSIWEHLMEPYILKELE